MDTVQRSKREVNFVVEVTDTGYSAYTEDGLVSTTAATRDELVSNILEAYNLFLEEEGVSEFIDTRNISVQMDMKQFFEHYSYLRTNALAKRIGMNPKLISQYVSGNKIPSSKQVERIMKGINSIGKELSKIDFATHIQLISFLSLAVAGLFFLHCAQRSWLWRVSPSSPSGRRF